MTHSYPEGRGDPWANKANPRIRSLDQPWRIPAPPPPTSHTRPRSRGSASQNPLLPRAARALDPHVRRFQCFGRFRNLDRTSVCRTQNRQAYVGTDRGTGWQAQAGTRDDQEGGTEWVRHGRGGQQHRSSLIPGITASTRVMFRTCQVHACARGFLQSPPRAGGRVRNPGPPQPQGLTLCDRQHQIRPAPRQG